MVALSRSLSRHRLAAAGWAALIALLLCTVPPPEPAARWGWVEALAEQGGDKAAHAALFAVQAWLLVGSRGVRPVTTGWLVGAFLVASLYGAATEAVQLALPGRDGTLGDLLADAAGAAAGAGAAWTARRRSPVGAPNRPARR